jgi:hypothetical protein
MAKNTETSDTGVAANDAYTGLLAISLLALIVGSVLLFLDYSVHSANPPKVTLPPVPTKAPVVPDVKDAPANKDAPAKDAPAKDAPAPPAPGAEK